MKKLVRVLAFPGYLKYFQRNLEYNYCKSMTNEVLRAIVDLRGSLEFFLSPLMQDHERTEQLQLGIIIACT